jgi:hypothetical protein
MTAVQRSCSSPYTIAAQQYATACRLAQIISQAAAFMFGVRCAGGRSQILTMLVQQQ